MYKLNKFIMLILLIFFVVLLTGCDYGYHLYHRHIREETEVTSIELIRYSNLNAQDNPLEDYPFDLEKLIVLEVLDSNRDLFLTDIEKIGGLSGKFKNLLNSPNGTGIRLIYEDEGFTIITITKIKGEEIIFCGHYNAEKNIEGKFGISWPEMIDDFKELINDYFTTEINWGK